MSITRQFVLGWAVAGAYMLAVLLLSVIQGLLDTAGVLSYQAGLILFALLHLLGLGLLVWGLLWVVRQPAYRLAHAQGTPMQARVLEVKRTGWRVRIMRQPVTYEHRLRVVLQPPDAPPYEAWVQLLLRKNQPAPLVGDSIVVKVHPRQRDVLVWSE